MTGQAGFRIPPGSTWPAQAQGLISVLGQNAALRRLHRRHGDVFSLRLPGLGVVVVVAAPALVRQVFTADPAVLHAGSGSPLGAVLGLHSLLAIDERRHLAQRRLLLPPFHGERL